MDESVSSTIEMRDALVLVLESANRRKRQEAAHALAEMSRTHRDVVAEIADVLIAALDHPEALTRWECLEALSEVALEYPERVTDAVEGAEDALFDEDSASTRLAGFKFLCRYGSLGGEVSRQVWPLIREAVQCFHGDPEYRDMLISLLEFAKAPIAPEVGEALTERMGFDAMNGRGLIRAYSKEICSVLEGTR